VRPPGLFLLLRGCAFSQLLIHNFRLYLNTIKRQADSGGPESAAILEKLKIDYAAIAE